MQKSGVLSSIWARKPFSEELCLTKTSGKWCSFSPTFEKPVPQNTSSGPTHTPHPAGLPALNPLSPVKVTRNVFLTVALRTVLQILVYGWRWTGMFLRRKAFGSKLLQWTAENKLFNGPFFWTTETTLVNTQKATKKHHKDKPHLGITRKSPQQTSPYHTG